MLAGLRSEDGGESTVGRPIEPRTQQRMGGVDPRSPPFRLDRLFFGGIPAFVAVDSFQNLGARIEYARGKGAPAPDASVPFSSGLLLAGGVDVTRWRLPRLSAAAVAGFFASVTPVMHDFWARRCEQRQQQMLYFLTDAALLGAALGLLELEAADGESSGGAGTTVPTRATEPPDGAAPATLWTGRGTPAASISADPRRRRSSIPCDGVDLC